MRSSVTMATLELDDRKASRKGLNGSSTEHASDDGDQNPKGSLFIGFDWGTNKSCLQCSYSGSAEAEFKTIVPTVVGYANDNIVDDLLPGNARMLFGAEALKHRLHLRLVAPMVDGIVKDASSARDFARHLRSLIDVPSDSETRVVIGVPANADPAGRDNMKKAVAGLFDKVILIPEPFLAALGCREENRLNDGNYVDPVSNSLFVDIGGGTSDICLVQGYFPTANDQISIAFAGDKLDQLLDAAIRTSYPDCDLSIIKVREIKEQHAYVGKPEAPIHVKVIVGGKPKTLDLTAQIGQVCGQLLERLFDGVRTLIARASSDSSGDLIQNIIITGGGSRIRNLDTELQRLLAEDGYENPRVRVAGENYKEFVARGALKAARSAKESQWQLLNS